MRTCPQQFLYASLWTVLTSLLQYSLTPPQVSLAGEFTTFHLINKSSGKEIRRLTDNDTIATNENLAIEARVSDSTVDKVRFEPDCGLPSITDEQKPFRMDLNVSSLKNNLSCKIKMQGWANPWNWKGQGNFSVNLVKSVSQTKATGTFHVVNGKIYDANEEEFIPMGLNSVHAWLNEANMRNALATQIKKSGANAVRLVTSGEAWYWTSQSTSPQKKRELVKMAVDAGLVPILELHDGTCESLYNKAPANGTMGLKQIVDHWLKPENVQLLKDYERYLILNIANEWGSNSTQWRDGYKQSIKRLRDAGIKNLILIDAGGNCGQNPNSILTWGKQIVEDDPLHNIAFSIHMYGLWTTPDKPYDRSWQFQVEDYLKRFKESGLAVIIGEFAWDSSSTVAYNPKLLVQKANEYGIGWLFWSWYCNFNEPYYNLTNNASYNLNSDADLSESGAFIINDPKYGMRSKARKASIFR